MAVENATFLDMKLIARVYLLLELDAKSMLFL